MFANNQNNNSALGAALQVGYKLLVRYLFSVFYYGLVAIL